MIIQGLAVWIVVYAVRYVLYTLDYFPVIPGKDNNPGLGLLQKVLGILTVFIPILFAFAVMVWLGRLLMKRL